MKPERQDKIVWDVVVIGGGPAGMMSAGRAGERGRRVILLEKNPTLGKKLLITGGGRCNVTNNKEDARVLLPKYKESDKFLYSAMTQFGVKETLKFFHDRGMETKEENEGRIFPVSNSAKSVFDVLVSYIKKNGVRVRPKSEVVAVARDTQKKQFIISLSDKSEIRAHSCILASGGTSRPETGSTGEGFQFLKKLGHKIVEDNMALVPIALKDQWVRKLAGLTLKEIKLTTFKNGTKEKVYKGKLLFTHFGLSGPTVLNMSQEVGELLHGGEGSEYLTSEQLESEKKNVSKKKSEVTIALDLFPNLDNAKLKEKIQALLIKESNKKIKNALSMLIPSALVEPVLSLSKIDGETPNHSVRSEERKVLVAILKAIPLHVKGLLGKDKAVVSSGGVVLDEVNFKTMQSRVLPNLYIVGDVLNIDRPSGGYSLQLCWTTGYVAGNSC